MTTITKTTWELWNNHGSDSATVGMPYVLEVFEGYPSLPNGCDVEIWIDGRHMETVTLYRTTHIVADMFDHVDRAFATWKKQEGLA